MLADKPIQPASGTLDKTVQKPDTFRMEVLDFLAGELVKWRARLNAKERQESETVLTDKLRSHLNSATRRSHGLDVLQFGSEVPDELRRGRAIDLAAKPCGAILVIQGRAYSDFDTILPVECKRLPIPQANDRDEREYVFSSLSSTGGIQRFKAGYHGGAHALGAMIAYVQEGSIDLWKRQIAEWIRTLAADPASLWSVEDLLHESGVSDIKVTRLRSCHQRGANLVAIALEHLWLEMN
jgi:hypothetical protein